MRKLILTILISSLGYSLNAQTNLTDRQAGLDSIWNIWKDQTQADTTRLKAIDDIAWDGYLFSQPDSAFYFAQMQYDLAKKSGLKKEMARALKTQGVSLIVRGDYPKALDCLKRSLELYEEMGNKRGIASCLGNIGAVYQNQGNILNALDHFQRCLKIKEEFGDKKGIAIALNNIGLIYMDQGDYPKALDYHQRSLKIKEEFGDKRGIAIALNNIGNIHMNKGDYPKALDHFYRCLKIEEEMGNKFGIAGSLNNIGLIYMDQGDYPKALDYHQRSLKLKEEFSDKQGIAASLNNIGFLYHKQGDYQKAINQCSKGLQLAEEIGDVELQSKACKCLYDGYKATGNGNKALEYHEQMLALDDSLNAEESAKALQRMEFAKQVLADSLVQVEKDLKVEMAHQTEVRKKDKNRNLAIGAGIFFLLLAGGFYGRWRYVKKSKAIIEKEKDRSNNLLLNILPADIAEELKIHGKAEARDFDMVSILFTDFKGFTQASEKLTAKELIKEINICFKAFDHICETHGVEKIKTIGDAYMAAGGLPVPSEDSTKNTVLAALEMQTFVSNRIIEKDKLNEMSFKMRLGIHTGPVVAGIVGVKKFQYDIWGDTVNTASRMESSGEIGKVNISEGTYALLKDDPELTFESRGKIEAKGKGQVEMYFVTKREGQDEA